MIIAKYSLNLCSWYLGGGRGIALSKKSSFGTLSQIAAILGKNVFDNNENFNSFKKERKFIKRPRRTFAGTFFFQLDI
jgi:hypothetical protein